MANQLPVLNKFQRADVLRFAYLPINNEGGWMLVVITMMIPLALVSLAFVIDLGLSYKMKEKIRHASDAALVATGRVYLERDDLKNGIDDSTNTVDPTADEREVEKLLEQSFLNNLKLNNIETGVNVANSPTGSFSAPPIYIFEPSVDQDGNLDGNFDIRINASYKTKSWFGFAFDLLPNSNKLEALSTKTTSAYKIAPKTKLIVGIILDLSQSVGQDRYNDLIVGLQKVVRNLSLGNYVSINGLDKFWNEDRHIIIPMTKIGLGNWMQTVPERTPGQIEYDILQYNMRRLRPPPEGTYMQGAIFRMRNEMFENMKKINTDAFPENDENWDDFRKVIFVLSDGAFSMRSEKYDNSSPYSPPANYVVPDEPMKACGIRSNVNPITIYEADQARKSGIIVASVCSENCNNGDEDGQRNRATMKRTANVDLDSVDENNLMWDSTKACYVPYLMSGNLRYKDPNPFLLPAGLKESDLFVAVKDNKVGDEINRIIKKIIAGGNQLSE
jgi:hypothetical protein